jgi:hypothetical protein
MCGGGTVWFVCQEEVALDALDAGWEGCYEGAKENVCGKNVL